DADSIVGWHLEHLARQFDGAGEPFLADFRPVRTADRGILQRLRRPAGALCARSRGEMGTGRTDVRFGECAHFDLSFQIARPSVGRGGPRTSLAEAPKNRNPKCDSVTPAVQSCLLPLPFPLRSR